MIQSIIRWLNRVGVGTIDRGQELEALYAKRLELQARVLDATRHRLLLLGSELKRKDSIIDNLHQKLAFDHKDYLKLLACILAGKFPDQGTQEEFERALDR